MVDAIEIAASGDGALPTATLAIAAWLLMFESLGGDGACSEILKARDVISEQKPAYLVGLSRLDIVC